MTKPIIFQLWVGRVDLEAMHVCLGAIDVTGKQTSVAIIYMFGFIDCPAQRSWVRILRILGLIPQYGSTQTCASDFTDAGPSSSAVQVGAFS